MDFLLPSVAFIEGLGGPEMVLVLVIVLVLFGGEKLPDFARGLGKSIREFKKAAAGVEEEFKRALEEDENKKSAALAAPTILPPSPAPVSHTETEPAALTAPATDTTVVVEPAETPVAIEPVATPLAAVVTTDAPTLPLATPLVTEPAKTPPSAPGLTEHLP